MRNNANGRSIIIEDVSKLQDYGFKKLSLNDYRYFTGAKNKFGDIYSILVCKLRGQRKRGYEFYVYSKSAQTLEVICRLFADGIIKFENYIDDNETIIRKKQKKIEQLQKEIEELKNG